MEDKTLAMTNKTMVTDFLSYISAKLCDIMNQNNFNLSQRRNEIMLREYGWNNSFEKSFKLLDKANLEPARVICENKTHYVLMTNSGQVRANVSGRFKFHTKDKSQFPVVGDWVAIKLLHKEKKAIIQNVLPRKSKFSRKAPGEKTREQVMVANIDVAFLVAALDNNRNFNPKRIQRYLEMSADSGAKTIIVLNKIDLCDDLKKAVTQAETIARKVPILTTCATKNNGCDSITKYLKEGQTAVFLGLSGVGKSTLINGLIGEEIMRVAEVREIDARGRHTTTRRELVKLTTGGMLIDTPGMRELQLWAEGIDKTTNTTGFEDIEALAVNCKFRNCKHKTEANCAVKMAIENNTLSEQRWLSYLELEDEFEQLAAKKQYQSQKPENLGMNVSADGQKKDKNKPRTKS